MSKSSPQIGEIIEIDNEIDEIYLEELSKLIQAPDSIQRQNDIKHSLYLFAWYRNYTDTRCIKKGRFLPM